MADIRLKTITIENGNPLTIKNNVVQLSYTTPSTNAMSGTLVTNGGIGVNCNLNSVSSTSGGAMTIAGGMAVSQDTYIGGNVSFDNNYTTFSINGILSNRVFVDSTTNKHIYFAPDGSNTRFNLTDTRVNIHLTQPSTNSSTGAFVVDGGISINSTNNTSNFSAGGAMTIAGGTCILGDTYLNKTLNVMNTTTLHNTLYFYDSISQNNTTRIYTSNEDAFITNSYGTIFLNATNGNIDLNTDTITMNGTLVITDTTDSLNASTGSLIVYGGLSISNTVDANSVTSGGGLTVAGGISISKKAFIGNQLAINLNGDSKRNKLMLYQNNNDTTQTHFFTGIGVTQGSMSLNVSDTAQDFIFYSCTNGSGSTVSNELFRIKGTNEVQFMGKQQSYAFIGGGSVNDAFSLQSRTTNKPCSFDLFTANGDANDDIYLKLFSQGLPNNITNSGSIQLGWNSADEYYNLSCQATGSGMYSDFIIANNMTTVTFDPNGITTFNATVPSTNSNSACLVVTGGVSIHETSASTSLTKGGALTVNGGASFASSIYVGNNLSIVDTNGTTENHMTLENNTSVVSLYSPANNIQFANNGTNTTGANMSLYNLGKIGSINSELLEFTSNNNVFSIQTSKQGNGILQPLTLKTGAGNQLFLATNGNVGIGTTHPNSTLDINGSIYISNLMSCHSTAINSTQNSLGLGSGGSLTVNGGTSIQLDTYIGGVLKVLNTSASYSSSSGAVIISGGVSINSTENAVIGYGGALSVYGGAYVAKDFYLAGNLNVGGSINGSGSSSTSYAYLTLTASDNAVNYSTGSFLTFGGITIQSAQNANSITDGGTILTPGGASIGLDLYVGGNIYNYGISNLNTTHYYNTGGNVIVFNDNYNVERFSIDRDSNTNNLSISRYNAGGSFIEKSIDVSNASGMIKFNNTTPSTDVNTGCLILAGGLTIQTTTNVTALDNGGSFTTYGGASIHKSLFVGGNTVFYSTTESTDISHGAVMIQGGLSVYKNMNIGGNTVIQGNLTVNGTTSTIESTNVNISDNVLVLNSGPAGSKDAGLFIQRYQLDNDSGLGDVVADTPYYTFILPSQSGINSTQIKLSSLSSSLDDTYTHMWIKISSGFSVNQVRLITNYHGATRIATLDAPWTSQNPSMNDTVSIYNKPYVGMIFNETNNRFEFGASLIDENLTTVSFTDHLPIYFSSATAVSTQPSTSTTEGALVLMSGGLSIHTTSDATCITSGGGLTIAGGTSIGKNLYVGSQLNVNGVNMTPNVNDINASVSFTAANNVSSPLDITGLSFNNLAWGFDVYLSAKLMSTSGNLYGNYHIRGVNKGGSWDIVSAYVGDSITEFNITSLGQIQYTTPNYPGFESLVFKFKAITN